MLDAGACREVGGADGECLRVVARGVVYCKMHHVGGDVVIVFDRYPQGDVDTLGMEAHLKIIVATLETDGDVERFFDVAVDGKEEAHAVGRGV